MTTIADCLTRSHELMATSDSAALDVEILLSHCLDKDRTYLRTWPERIVEPEHLQSFDALFARRLTGEPIAYLVGGRGFWTLDLVVNSSTLIPRPDTELLVECALERLPQESASILDLGTGTGAIALAIASENPQWQVVGCDRQPEAVSLAELNRQQCHMNNAEFILSNWFGDIPPQSFDMIVSNPPYIDPQDPHLLQGDVRFEPHSALVAANKGLADIEHIIGAATPYLKPNGWLLFEHGYDQAAVVRGLLQASGYHKIESIKDLADLDRVTLAQKAS